MDLETRKLLVERRLLYLELKAIELVSDSLIFYLIISISLAFSISYSLLSSEFNSTDYSFLSFSFFFASSSSKSSSSSYEFSSIKDSNFYILKLSKSSTGIKGENDIEGFKIGDLVRVAFLFTPSSSSSSSIIEGSVLKTEASEDDPSIFCSSSILLTTSILA